MRTIPVCPVGTDLASRQSAALLRSNINTILTSGHRVALDLSQVESISESYADELFGVLVLERGLVVFSKAVSVRGATRSVLRRIAGAIRERLEKRELEGTLDLLVAAKHANNRSASRKM